MDWRKTWTMKRTYVCPGTAWLGLAHVREIVFSTLAACLILSGCSLARQEQEPETGADLAVETEANTAVERCNATYMEGDRAVVLARARCLNDALAKVRPLMRFPDLLDVDAANRLVVAGKEQKGHMTHIDAMQQFATMHSKVIAEEQHRMSTNGSVGAKALSVSLMPVACTRYGDMATCY
jgi:hypothetical protein